MSEVSDEYLQSFLLRFNVDGSEISNKRLDDMLQHVVSQEDLVTAVAEALLTHIDAAAPFFLLPQGIFDERLQPPVGDAAGGDYGPEASTCVGASSGSSADDDASPALSVVAEDVAGWLRTTLQAVEVDSECVIISLVLLERVLLREEPELRLTRFSWRRATLCALVVAAKTWYDEVVFSADFLGHLPHFGGMTEMEAAFLRMLDYKTAVPVSLFVRYAFALQDIVQHNVINALCLNRSRSQRPKSWSPGAFDTDAITGALEAVMLGSPS